MDLNSLSPETVQLIKDNGGISGNLSAVSSIDELAQATQTSARNSVPIRGGQSALRPNVEGNIPSEGLVERPSLGRFNIQFAETRQLELIESERAAKELADLRPQALLASIHALSRKVARLEKQIKNIQGAE